MSRFVGLGKSTVSVLGLGKSTVSVWFREEYRICAFRSDHIKRKTMNECSGPKFGM